MDCTVIQIELLPYHLGGLPAAECDAVEAHLVECTDCLRAYLRLKRHLERGAAARPSDATRKRLRDDVAEAFRPPLRERARRWFERPIPLYQGLAVAAAAVVLVAAFAAPENARGPSPSPIVTRTAPVVVATPNEPGPRAGAPRVDTSRHDAENLAFY